MKIPHGRDARRWLAVFTAAIPVAVVAGALAFGCFIAVTFPLVA